MLEAKSKRPWLFVNRHCVRLLPCSQTLPGFQGFTERAVRREACQELGGEDLMWGRGHVAENLAVRHARHTTQLSGSGQGAFGFHTASDSPCWEERGSVGRRPAPADCVAEV